MPEQKEYKRGSAVRMDISVRDIDDLLKDPDSITITISENTAGTAKVSAVAMTKASIGKYYYVCQTLSTWTVDWYDVLITAVLGAYTVIYSDRKSFKLLT